MAALIVIFGTLAILVALLVMVAVHNGGGETMKPSRNGAVIDDIYGTPSDPFGLDDPLNPLSTLHPSHDDY